MENQNIISLQKICFAYENQIVLRYFDLDIKRGECVALMGANGCGKSTLLKIISGVLHAEEGTYLFEGEAVNEKSLSDSLFAKKMHQKIGLVFQNADVQLFCSSVYDEIAFGPMQMQLTEEEVMRRTEDVIELLNIGHLRDRAPYHLSGGEKRKVSLACILSMNPSVLLLDEPLAGLDRETKGWLTEFLLQFKESGKTIVFATHDDRIAAKLADRIIEM